MAEKKKENKKNLLLVLSDFEPEVGVVSGCVFSFVSAVLKVVEEVVRSTLL